VLLRYSPFDAGYEEIDWYYAPGKSGMYYSMFSATGHSPTVPDVRVPLILWLQGGPGASSQFGAFTEIGPIRITSDRIYEFGKSWNIMGHTVFIDQPLGVGFSYNDKTKPLVNSARQAADHLLNFLSNLYKQWPALKTSPLYITG
jgi:carboxypeptidase C (cathepsin A)